MQDFRPHTAQLPRPNDLQEVRYLVTSHVAVGVSAQMVWLAAVLAASSAHCLKIRMHHQTCLSTVKLRFHPVFSNSRMLDMLGHPAGDFEKASDDVTRWSQVLHCSMPKISHKGKKRWKC